MGVLELLPVVDRGHDVPDDPDDPAGGLVALVLRGRLTLRSLPRAREQLHTALARMALQPSGGQLVLDLSGVTACDATGLALLVSVERLAHARGQQLQLGRLPAPVARALMRHRLSRRAPGPRPPLQRTPSPWS